MEITIEDEKSVNGSVVNRGTISMYKKVRSSKKYASLLHSRQKHQNTIMFLMRKQFLLLILCYIK